MLSSDRAKKFWVVNKINHFTTVETLNRPDINFEVQEWDILHSISQTYMITDQNSQDNDNLIKLSSI